MRPALRLAHQQDPSHHPAVPTRATRAASRRVIKRLRAALDLLDITADGTDPELGAVFLAHALDDCARDIVVLRRVAASYR